MLFCQWRNYCSVKAGNVVLSRQEIFCQGKNRCSVKARNAVLSRQEMLVFQSRKGLSVKARFLSRQEMQEKLVLNGKNSVLSSRDQARGQNEGGVFLILGTSFFSSFNLCV